MMTVKAYCEKYGIKPKTVYKRISEHKNGALAGHVTKVKGKPIEIDDFAEQFLKTIKVKIREVVNDYDRIYDENLKLTDKADALESDNVQLRTELEECRAERDSYKDKAERLETELDCCRNNFGIDLKMKDETIAECRETIEKLKSELEAKKNESVFEHIKGKNK